MRESRSGAVRVTSAPRKRISPAVARSSPLSRFRNVDFPAPLGPIRAWTWPSSKASDTPSTADNAPNRRVSASVCSSISGTARSRDEPCEPAGKEEHDRDHQRRDQRIPVSGHTLPVMLDEREQQCSQRGPVQRALATEQDGDEDQPGLAPAELSGIDEPVEVCVQVSGETCQRSRDHERDQLVAAGRVPEGPRPLLVAEDPFQNPPVGGPQHAREQQIDEHHGRPDGDIRRSASLDGARFDEQPVGAAQRRRIVEQIEEHLREGQGHHDEVHAGRAQAEPADDERAAGREGHAEGKRHDRVHQVESVAEPCEQVRGKAEERRVREADEAGESDQQIQAHGEDRADHRFSQELQPEAIAAEGHRAQGRRRGEQDQPPLHRPSNAGPSRPRGRQSSTAAITAYTMALAKPGRSTLPKVSARPTSSAPKKAPLIEPIPPITTTTNERMRTFSPIPGYTVVSGAASIPARPASAVPALKTIANRRRTSIPSASTISAFEAPARTRMPKRVLRTIWRMATPMQTQARAVSARHAGQVCVSPSGIVQASAAGVLTPCTSLPHKARCSSLKSSTNP